MMTPETIMTRYAPVTGFQPGAPGNGFTLIVDPPFPHRRLKDAMYSIAELHLRQQNYGLGGGMLITGPSGVGKSTVLKTYQSQFPRVHEETRTYIPVLYVKVPPSPTSRSLAGAILEALGEKRAHRGTAPEKTARICELFPKCGVELVLLDEFHHLLYASTLNAFRDVTDWLKNFVEDTRVGVVGCGLPSAEHVVDSNEQLARRFSSRIQITPFQLEDTDDFQEFRGILKALESLLPFPCDVPLHEANLARRFHVGSYGLLDYVVKIIEGAVSAAARIEVPSIDLTVLAAGFRDRVWREVPDRLNSFHPASVLRPLDRAGEVFHLHNSQDLVGSPAARKLGMNLTRGSGA